MTDNVLGFLWAKEAYGAMLFATAVSDLSIADALAEPRYRALFVAAGARGAGGAQAPPEPFDGFDADDLDGSLERLVAFNRRSAKTHSGIYRDLAVRRRPVEPLLDGLGGPLRRPHARADRRDRGRPAGVRGGEPRAAGRPRADGGRGRR